jgi:hypothetical protein
VIIAFLNFALAPHVGQNRVAQIKHALDASAVLVDGSRQAKAACQENQEDKKLLAKIRNPS